MKVTHLKKGSIERIRESIQRHLGKTVAEYKNIDYVATSRRTLAMHAVVLSLPHLRAMWVIERKPYLLGYHKSRIADARRLNAKWLSATGGIP